MIGLPAARRPTAAICADDLLAPGMLQEMVRHGVRVPENFAIVGYDDIDVAAAAAVPLSSGREPWYELSHTHEQLVFEPRRSCANRAWCAAPAKWATEGDR